MPKADVNEISINYEFDGPASGQFVVLINGLADDLHTWDLQVKAFTLAGYRVLRYDNRGIGQTSRPQGPYTSSILAKDLFCLLKHLQVSSFHLMGVSMGGMIAQTYALEYPNDQPSNPRLLSLALACTYARPSPFCSRLFRLWADMAVKMSVQDVMRDVLCWAFTVTTFVDREDEIEEVEKGMQTLDMMTPEYLAQLHVIESFDSRTSLVDLTASNQTLGGLSADKIMVLAGEEDILIPVILSKELWQLLPGAVWETCKGGHGACWEFPDEFNDAYLSFLCGK